MWLFDLQVDLLHHGPDPDDTASTSQGPGPVLPEQLVPETVDDGAQEARDDVDEQEEDGTNLQAEPREEGDEGGNHEGEHAQQQLREEGHVFIVL